MKPLFLYSQIKTPNPIAFSRGKKIKNRITENSDGKEICQEDNTDTRSSLLQPGNISNPMMVQNRGRAL